MIITRDHAAPALRSMRQARHEALRCIPSSAGRDWREVLGSDGLPGAGRLRGQEHASKPVTGPRYQGRRPGGIRRDMVKVDWLEA
jgi:hypothetical protein